MNCCTHMLDNAGLHCVLTEHPETPRGHVYESTSGVPDRHSATSGEC